MGAGILIASQSMIFGLAINIEDQTPPSVKLFVQLSILAGTLLVMLLLTGPLVRNAWADIRRRRLTIEALFLLTMSGALFASLQSLISGHGPIYFEVVTVLLVVYTLGKIIGARSRVAALESTRAWATGLSSCRIVDADRRLRTAEVSSVEPGDVVEVRPGEAISVDGVIKSGFGFVSAAAVSGEPFAVVRRPGDQVFAGMISHDALFLIESTAQGTTRQVDRLFDAVERAREQPSSLQAYADRLSRIFFPLIVLTALATFTIWTMFSGWQAGLFNAMSVLLVACPCALGLATPIVVWSALNRMAERGFVVHSGDIVERLAKVDSVVFDKTGTLTEDRFQLVDVATLDEGESRARILAWLALVEERSNHPIARPLADLPREIAAGQKARLASYRVVPGCGVEADLDTETAIHSVRLGRPDWLGKTSTREEAILLGRLRSSTGKRIDFEIDGRLSAIAMVAERLRESTPDALVSLRNMSISVHVLTGDSSGQTAVLALPNVRSGLLPEDKHRIVGKMKAAGHKPLMVGDGINDASALSAAHVGIALSSGTDLANNAASATIYHDDLRVIPWAIALSRDAVRTIRRNLWRAACYNVIGIALAAAGVLHPIAAALLMVVSSLLAAWSSVRVGTSIDLCACTDEVSSGGASNIEATKPRAASAHALALSLQAVCAALLLDLDRTTLIGVFATFILLGGCLSYVWSRWSKIPHGIDMTFGMLTLGNLGMLLGWWADNGFQHLPCGTCRECVAVLREGLIAQPWMWVGMLTFANLAMAFLARRPHPAETFCRVASLIAGNLGMLVGMLIGGLAAAQLEVESVALAALTSFIAMTMGMVMGMLLCSAIVQWSFTAIANRRAKRWNLVGFGVR